MIKRYRLWFIVGGVLLLLIITNPSIKAFKDYKGATSYYGIRRTLNLFVFSVYERMGYSYIGVLGNFINISKDKSSTTATQNSTDPFSEFGGHLLDSATIDTIRTKRIVSKPPERN